jgi:hypothetical protein
MSIVEMRLAVFLLVESDNFLIDIAKNLFGRWRVVIGRRRAIVELFLLVGWDWRVRLKKARPVEDRGDLLNGGETKGKTSRGEGEGVHAVGFANGVLSVLPDGDFGKVTSGAGPKVILGFEASGILLRVADLDQNVLEGEADFALVAGVERRRA